MNMSIFAGTVCAAMLLGLPCAARAQSVAMSGGMGSRALLVIDGGAPKAVGPGDTHKGVKVLSVTRDEAVVEIGGKRQTVVLGAAPVRVGGGGGAAGGNQIVLAAVSGGHFVTQGSVNGRAAQLMVDTGATMVAMGADDARRMGVSFENGDRFYSNTANGRVIAYRVILNSVRIQDVEVFGVEAAVLPQGMPYVLLGNSFLSRFQMKRDNDTLTLTRRF